MTTTVIRHRGGTYRAVKPARHLGSHCSRSCAVLVSPGPPISRTSMRSGFLPSWPTGPMARPFAVSLGTGLDPMQARSAPSMESIEFVARREPRARSRLPATPPSSLDLPYDHPGAESRHPLATDRDTARSTGRPAPACSAARPSRCHWILSGWTSPMPARGRTRSSARQRNGVASGNTPVEATLHGMLEAIERDCIAERQATDAAELRYVDVGQASSEYVRRDSRPAGHLRLRDIGR